MRKGMTISGASLLGMVAVSWISILVIGGFWVYSMYRDFRFEADRLRQDHYAEQRNLVKAEVEDAVGLVAELRYSASQALLRELESRVRDVRALVEVLKHDLVQEPDEAVIRLATVRLMAAQDGSEARLYALHGASIYLISPFPRWIDKGDALAQIESALASTRTGRSKLSLKVPEGAAGCTLLLTVNEFDSFGLRVVAGASLEMAEESVKEKVLDRLSEIRYAKNGSLFGGTYAGESLLGPVRGRDMWNVIDVNGVKIVQELVAAAKSGGGFVSYVMPPLDGQRNAEKVSYVMPIPDWDWYVGTGAFVNDIENVINLKRKQLEQNIEDRVLLILAGMAALSLLALYLSHRLSRKLDNNVAAFIRVWTQATSGKDEIDIKSLYYSEFRQLAEAANYMVAELRAVQDALSGSLERFSSLVSNIPGIVFHCDNENGTWERKYVGGSVLEMTGHDPQMFIDGGSAAFKSIIHPEDREWVGRIYEDDLNSRSTYTADYRIIRKDGEIRWLSERGRVLRDDAGRHARIDGVIFDVSDRKLAEEEYYNHIHFLETLERIDRAMHMGGNTQEMLRNIMEAIRHAFGADRAWLLHPCDVEEETFTVRLELSDRMFANADGEGSEVSMDHCAREVFGGVLDSPVPLAYDPSTGREIPDYVRERYGIQSQLMFALRPRVGKPWILGLHHCREARVWTGEEIRLFTEAGRRLSDGLSTALVLDRLTESEEQFRTFSEQTMLGLLVLQENRIIFVNQATADIVETSVEELMALPPNGFERFLHPDDRDFVVDQGRRKQAGDPDVVPSYSWRVVTATGRVKWLHLHSKSTRVNGRTADLISLVDISALKRAEEDLESLVAQRTSDLARKAEELKRANAELTRLDDLKSFFLTTVSHAMRTPLTSVLGYSVLIRRELERALEGRNGGSLERAVDNLDVMETEGKRLHHLVDQFMELADMEAQGDLRTPDAHPVGEAIRKAVESAREECRTNVELTLEMDDSGTLPEINVSPAHLERVVGYLLENACNYTREGSIVVRVTSPNGAGIDLAVADTGKGIPDEELEAIFKPFHQVETGDTLVDEIKGAGLGLALCRMVVEKLGGRVWAESAKGRGAVFHISLPGAG
ncbi:cache domain-containing protein [Pseudodesulfovibrio indicus]|uniref:histidine kinase n=2 Tax=Pseudodesulfovibrio indicus TaxID=1716143 RepID=A0AA94PPX6_9BACT|nr:cache domain-containing protein [Pseudodesulfovibrio indicus]TDT90807.1 PAS domain S-box-containing protein [Pseudodesulfovibrio indicus]